MTYLSIIKYKLQNYVETLASALDIDVAIADKNLIRIVGTGDFYSQIDKRCTDDSLFAKVIREGNPIINLSKDENCKNCSQLGDCTEFANMTYPIFYDKSIIGLISFASFDEGQAENIRLKREEYFNMLVEASKSIEREIENINLVNKIEKDYAELSEIINSLNKGIIVVNYENKVRHINSKALYSLNLSLSKEKIIGISIGDIIKNIELKDTGDRELIGFWKIKDFEIKVIYMVNKIILKEGFYNYIISFDRIKDIINIAKNHERREDIKFSNLIGESKVFLETINRSKIASNTDSTILIQGESGTGKELFARSIHNESYRREGPFIPINCASIPENLIESELFGYEKGSFTGADPKGKTGKIEAANNGTLFLDEIGDLPIYLQTKLLRVLQERAINKIGSNKEISVNIRVISATNKDLRQMVDSGSFRLDLYYRLNVIPIKLPPLKDREEDVLLCSDYIIDKLCEKMNIIKKRLEEDVIKLFLSYRWPGNIRELENILEHGICFSRDDYIRLEDLPGYILEIENKAPKKEGGQINLDTCELEKIKSDLEENIIRDLIKKYGDSVDSKKIIAKNLNISLATLYRKIKHYQI